MNFIDSMKRLIPKCWGRQALAGSAFQRATNNGTRVMSGPFAGMKYVDAAIGSAWHPKLMGTYEIELHERIDDFCNRKFANIIDVGAADGYYAVGMALRTPDAKITAFETVLAGQALLKRLAEINLVASRIKVLGFCDDLLLKATLQEIDADESVLIIMDIEGGELSLLQPQLIPRLKTCVLLVELHDCFFPGLDIEVVKRFQSTHQVRRIWAHPRVASELPFPPSWLSHGLLNLANEFRPAGMSWLYMEPCKS